MLVLGDCLLVDAYYVVFGFRFGFWVLIRCVEYVGGLAWMVIVLMLSRVSDWLL